MTLIGWRSLFILLSALVGCSTTYKSPEYATPAETATSPQPNEESLMLSWPMRGTVSISRGFMLGIRPHQGMDIVAPKGTPVKAAHSGYVEYAGRDFSGYGNLVIINSGGKWATFYAHLNRIRVREKQSVKRGQHIGDVGATGNARGVHLHFELRYDQRPVDPAIYLP